MAWQPMTIAGETDGIAHVWHSAGRWLMRDLPNEQYYRAADLAAIAAAAKPGGEYGPVGDLPAGAATDGARWYVVGYWGAARSTDGLTGAAWEPIASAPGSLRVVGGHGGTVVVVNIGGYLKVSTDQGASWADRAYFPGFGDEARWGITHTGTHFAAWAASGYLLTSADNGVTWQTRTPPIAVAEFAGIEGAWIIAPAGAGAAYVSTDQGVTWSPAGLDAGVARRLAATGGHAYQYEPATPRLQRSADLVQWEDIGLPAASPTPDRMVAGSGAVVLWSATAGALPYYDPEPAPAYVQVSTSWPVTIAAAPDVRAATPWPVTVAAAQQAATGWPVQVLDAAVIGGLDGAASWAAAPDGKWEAVVWLGDANISARLAGVVSVQIEADAARTAEFAFLPAAAIQPLGLIGQRVRIAFAQAGGLNAQTIFRGVVDTPTIDLQAGIITCACHDQAQEVWTGTPRETIDALVGGRWHEAVSGEPEDNYDYLRERIQSVGASWALDANQAPRILPWGSPARAVTVRQADVIDGDFDADLPSREQLRTRIDVRMQYRYTVLRVRGISAQWSQPLGFFLPKITATQTKQSYGMPSVGMVESAADNPPGWERVSLAIENPPADTWNVGTELQPAIYNISKSAAPSLAIGFSGLYRARWQQTVTEDYSIAVVWDALEAQIGQPVPEEIGASLESRFDVPGWDSDSSVAPRPAVLGVGDVSVPYYAPGAAPADRDEVLRALLDRAWVRLWSASRTGRVRFAVPCRPDLWLDTGCVLEGGRVRASGVIVSLEHALDVQSGRATTDVAVAVGMPGDTPAALPVWSLPASPYTPAPPQIGQLSAKIGTYVGGLVGSPPFDPEAMIGLVTNEDGAEMPGRNYYPVGLSIGWPELTADDRDPRELEAAVVVSVAVPTDLLEIT